MARSEARRHDGYEIRPFPWLRRLVVDAGRASRHRHSVYGLFEVDVTGARERMHEIERATGKPVSMTAWVTTNFARTIADDRSVQAYRDVFGRLVVFDSVDVNVIVESTIEGRPFPMNHVIRDVQDRSVTEVQNELRLVKRDPSASPSARLVNRARVFAALPSFVRSRLLSLASRFPTRYRSLLGTAGVTAVGMFGRGGGWGIAFQTHSIDLLVGGTTTRPALQDGELVEREYLALTLMVDHDVVDGGPAARFAIALRARLEAVEGLDALAEDGTKATGA